MDGGIVRWAWTSVEFPGSDRLRSSVLLISHHMRTEALFLALCVSLCNVSKESGEGAGGKEKKILSSSSIIQIVWVTAERGWGVGRGWGGCGDKQAASFDSSYFTSDSKCRKPTVWHCCKILFFCPPWSQVEEGLEHCNLCVQDRCTRI